MPTFSPNTTLNRLDRIALAILGYCGSLMDDKNTALKTANHDLRCVAVTDINGTLLVAANNVFVTKDVIASFRRGPKTQANNPWSGVKNNVNKGDAIGDDRNELFSLFSEMDMMAVDGDLYDGVVFVTGIHSYFNNYHAEMQLLQFMLDYHVRPTRRYIGVSKPCCPECTAILQDARFQFAESHTLNAHVVGNAERLFTHPHLRLDELATEFARGAQSFPKSLGGSYLAPF
jgi:OTT_1508-like deaminase